MLAPNMTLALEVLRMQTFELRAFLEQQLEENPLLEFEVEEPYEEAPEPSQTESNGSEEPQTNGLDEEWLSHWRISGEREDSNTDDAWEEHLIDQRQVHSQSLHESLRLQLGCLTLPEEERKLGEALIQALDEHGYLEGTLDQLAAELSVKLDQVEAALRLIQRLDPPGVGARDLRECLMLQLEQSAATGNLAYHILKDHFKLFAQNALGGLAKATGASPAQVSEACKQLKQLNPRPGRIFAGELPPSVIPDLVIHHREKHYDVELNYQDLPHVTISRAYYRMLKDPRTPPDAKEFLSAKFRKATWLIKAVDERNTTLLSIARCLISLQREFLDQGPKAIKTLTQAQVADLVGRHPSTVSRAIAGKTIDTPCGIFRLEQLFASGVPQSANQNEPISDERIKSELQRLVADEEPHRPLSDEALAKRLAERNISVARRTIAKYRTSLKILPAHMRKQRL